MKQFLTVLGFELNNYFKNKSFVITSILLTIILVGLIVVPALIPGFLDDDKDKRPDISEAFTMEEAEKAESEEPEEVPVTGLYIEDENLIPPDAFSKQAGMSFVYFDSADELRAAVETEKLENGVILSDFDEFTYVVYNKKMSDYTADAIENVLLEIQKELYLAQKGLNTDEIMELNGISVDIHEEILGKDGVTSYGYTYVMIFVVYFMILFYGQMIAVSVTNEKNNRAIEILITSVNSNSLIFGKVMAGAIAGIGQMALFMGAGFAAYTLAGSKWGGILDIFFDIPAGVMVSFILLSLLSYLLYSFIFGALGALVSKTEDISKTATPVTIIYIVSFFIGMFGMNFSDSLVIKAASFIPFTSGNAMLVRVAMGNVSMAEVIISIAILAVSCMVMGVLAAKLFRFGTLHYGNPVKIRRALSQIKADKEK